MNLKHLEGCEYDAMSYAFKCFEGDWAGGDNKILS